MSKGPWKGFGSFTRVPLYKDVTIRGFKLRIYSVKWLCYAVSRSSLTLFLWEKRGILPRPILTVKTEYESHWKDMRWYTSVEILGYAQIIHELERAGKLRPYKSIDLKNRLHAHSLKIRTAVKENPAYFLPKLPKEPYLLLLASANRREQRIQYLKDAIQNE